MKLPSDTRMSTLSIPVGVWQQQPNAAVTASAASKEGDRIICGLSDGTLAVFSYQNELQASMLCVGPPSPVIFIVCYQIDLEECSTADNVFLSISNQGYTQIDAAIWHCGI